MENFAPLMAEIGLPVWGTAPNFNRFRVLASLLQQRCSPEANQTLHDLWPSPRLVHCTYIFGGFRPWRNFCHVQNSLCIQVLFLYIAALLHGTPAAGLSQTTTFMAIIQDNLVSRHPEFRIGGFCWSSFTAHLPLLIATSVFGVGRRH